MYAHYFAKLLRAFSPLVSRRGLLAGVASGVFAASPFALDSDEAAAKRNGKRKRKRKNAKKNKNQPPAGPTVRADATCPGPSTSDPSAGGLARLAQTFTALASGPLVSAQLLISKDPGSTSDYILRLSPVDGAGVPTNDVLAATFVANGSVPDGESLVTFAFANPAAVVAGTQYALVHARPGTDNFTWLVRAGDACVGQRFVSNSPTAPFAVDTNGNAYIYTTLVSS
jgi:hypothetical protein